MRKFILRLLVRWYANQLDEIFKQDDFEQLKAYRFKDAEATEKILKANITAQTLWHFEARSDEERWMAKGATLMLKIMRESHQKALKVYQADNPDKSLEEWKKWKKFNRTN